MSQMGRDAGEQKKQLKAVRAVLVEDMGGRTEDGKRDCALCCTAIHMGGCRPTKIHTWKSECAGQEAFLPIGDDSRMIHRTT